MHDEIRILLQTTIPFNPDDWHAGRFSLLRDCLASLPQIRVLARDRHPDREGNDPILSRLDDSRFDQLWLIAVDGGDGLSPADARGINRFQRQGGGLLTARDHQDVGSSLCALERVGPAHKFHTRNPETDPERRTRDDPETDSISWPNYRSGANGDYQWIEVAEPVHPLLLAPTLPRGRVRRIPAHPHEGVVSLPPLERDARIIAWGRSLATGRSFGLAVAFDSRGECGRAVAHSSFHHFADYNWCVATGCPTFVCEPAGEGYRREPEALDEVKAYVANLAYWLSHRPGVQDQVAPLSEAMGMSDRPPTGDGVARRVNDDRDPTRTLAYPQREPLGGPLTPRACLRAHRK